MKIILNKTIEDTYNLSIDLPASASADMFTGGSFKKFIIYGLPLADLRDMIEQLTARVAVIEEAAAKEVKP